MTSYGINTNWKAGIVATGQTVAKNRIVVAAAAGGVVPQILHAANATTPFLGVSQFINRASIDNSNTETGSAGDSVSFSNTDGDIVFLEVNGDSANIAVNDPITATTAGVGVKATLNTQHIIGHALAVATTDGVLIPVVLNRRQLVVD